MYSFLAISITIGCCLYSSLTDLKERKIKNLCSFGLLYCGLIIQVLFWLQGQIPFSYVVAVTLGGGTLAYLSYILHFFAPGDAKLFWAACVALPPFLFESPQGYVFSPLVLGINTFVPYLLGLLVYALFKTDMPKKLQSIRTVVAPKAILLNFFSLLGFIGIGIIISATIGRVISGLSIPLGPVVRFLLILGAYQLIYSWAKAKKLEAVIPILGTSICLIAFIYMGFYIPGDARQYLLILISIYIGVYAILRPLILSLAEPVLTKEVKIAALEVGMIPAETILKEEKEGEVRYFKVVPTQPQMTVVQDNVLIQPSRPLDTATVQRLKEEEQKGCFDSFGSLLRIQKTIAFAPFIALGVLFTVIFRGPFYSIFS